MLLFQPEKFAFRTDYKRFHMSLKQFNIILRIYAHLEKHDFSLIYRENEYNL